MSLECNWGVLRGIIFGYVLLLSPTPNEKEWKAHRSPGYKSAPLLVGNGFMNLNLK